MVGLDFQMLRCFPVKVNLAGALGVGCSKFVFQRNATSEAPHAFPFGKRRTRPIPKMRLVKTCFSNARWAAAARRGNWLRWQLAWCDVVMA